MGRLVKTTKYSGKIEVVSGLMIGGSNAEIRIGGVDHEVVKHPITDEPYIPGSSLKGKVRSLLESKYGRKDRDNKPSSDGLPCRCGRCDICKLFGAHMNTKSVVAPPRLLFRDAHMSDESKEMISSQPLEKNSYLEIKAENCIDRNTGTASNPRMMERVVPGIKFDFEIVLQIFEGDNEDRLKGLLEEGLEMLENNYLGGRGSAGNGEISFVDCEWSDL